MTQISGIRSNVGPCSSFTQSTNAQVPHSSAFHNTLCYVPSRASYTLLLYPHLKTLERIQNDRLSPNRARAALARPRRSRTFARALPGTPGLLISHTHDKYGNSLSTPQISKRVLSLSFGKTERKRQRCATLFTERARLGRILKRTRDALGENTRARERVRGSRLFSPFFKNRGWSFRRET